MNITTEINIIMTNYAKSFSFHLYNLIYYTFIYLTMCFKSKIPIIWQNLLTNRLNKLNYFIVYDIIR